MKYFAKFRWQLYCPVHLQHTYSDSIFLVSNDDHYNLGRWPFPHFSSEYCKHIYTQMQQRTQQCTADKRWITALLRELRVETLSTVTLLSTLNCPNIGPSFLTNNAAGTLWGDLVSSSYHWQIEAPNKRNNTSSHFEAIARTWEIYSLATSNGWILLWSGYI